FQTYASRRVQGAMLDYLRSLDWKPRSVRARSRIVEKAVHARQQRLGAKASEEDVAEEIGISIHELGHWMQKTEISQAGNGPDDMSGGRLLELMADPSESPEEAVS